MAEAQLPEDVEAERSLLATLCAPGNETVAAQVASTLDGQDFLKPQHRAVFQALVKILSVGSEINCMTLHDEMKKQHTAPLIGNFTGLVELLAAEEVGKPSVLADILKSKRRFRDLIKLGANLARQAAGETASPEELIQEITAAAMLMVQGRERKGLEYINAVGESAMQRMVDVAEGRATPGLPTGLPKLDHLLGGGFKPGQLIILAARPGIGKSALAIQWAEYVATRHATVAAWILEMGAEEVWYRLASKHTHIPSYRLATGQLNAAEWQDLHRAKADIQGLPLLINDQAEITPLEIRSQLDHATARYGSIGLAVVDYLQLMTGNKDSNRQKSEATRVGELSRALKLMAKDRGIPVVILSQLNREVEKRTGGRPQLSDLRDSGSIEQDADVVCFLHRKPDKDAEPGAIDDTAELILAKNRNGPLGTIPLSADLANFTFRERERETNPVGVNGPPQSETRDWHR